MKKLLLLLSVLSTVFGYSCAQEEIPADTTASPDTTRLPETTLAPETTAAPEVKEEISNLLFADGKSEYSIAFSDTAYATYATELSNLIFSTCKINSRSAGVSLYLVEIQTHSLFFDGLFGIKIVVGLHLNSKS